MSTCCIIIPCFNEANRLNQEEFLQFIKLETSYSLLFVNDGSTDQTAQVIKQLRAIEPERIHILNNNQNCGKSETIRIGMLHALSLSSFTYLAFLDADLATPIKELCRLVNFLVDNDDFEIAIGSRIKRLGAQIERNALRHYLGRLFVTYTNFWLPVYAYDSQCGAKVFRSSVIEQIFQKPFVSNWFFDIEIILRSNKNKIAEIPLIKWFEVGKSRLKIKDFLIAPFEILRIKRDYKKRDFKN
jgi:dolichyl-phosphate beta-glucosyltransferase